MRIETSIATLAFILPSITLAIANPQDEADPQDGESLADNIIGNVNENIDDSAIGSLTADDILGPSFAESFVGESGVVGDIEGAASTITGDVTGDRGADTTETMMSSVSGESSSMTGEDGGMSTSTSSSDDSEDDSEDDSDMSTATSEDAANAQATMVSGVGMVGAAALGMLAWL